MGSRALERHIKWKRGIAHFNRKIPIDLKHLYAPDSSQTHIMKSLGTRDLIEAERRRDAINAATEDLWELYRQKGRDPEAIDEYKRKVEQAKALGFAYMPLPELLQFTSFELFKRLNEVENSAGRDDAPAKKEVADALLGTVERPELTISEAFEEYWKLSAHKVADKSEGQLRIWKHGRKRAMANFVEVVGDKPFMAITRHDCLDFMDWWFGRVKAGEVKADTANKENEILCDVFQTVIDKLRLTKVNEMRGLRLKKEEADERQSMTRDEVIACLFTGNPLARMNEEARAVVEICAELGTRPIEIINREASDIILDAEIPHVKIRKNKYGKLKTVVSRRDLPLVGASLIAFKKFPNGFSRYGGKSSSCVTAINKFFRENKILIPGATLYSLRHAFEDRLVKVEAPDRVEKELMGHAVSGTKYGAGPDLEQKLEWLNRIALQ